MKRNLLLSTVTALSRVLFSLVGLFLISSFHRPSSIATNILLFALSVRIRILILRSLLCRLEDVQGSHEHTELKKICDPLLSTSTFPQLLLSFWTRSHLSRLQQFLCYWWHTLCADFCFQFFDLFFLIFDDFLQLLKLLSKTDIDWGLFLIKSLWNQI